MHYKYNHNALIMKELIKYLWQLPQNLLGLFLIHIYKDVSIVRRYGDIVVYQTDDMPSGISLGRYVIMKFTKDETGIKHELGHSRQSQKLGWLYLIVIGLPSLLGNIYDRIFHRNWRYEDVERWYYSQPWEKWADKLGGVKRWWRDY